MTLYDRIKSDNKRMLGEDMGPMTLYDADGVSQTATGRWTDIGMSIDPQGQPFASKKYTVAFHIDLFDEITSPEERYKDWEAEFINSQGETIKGRFIKPLVDETFNYVSTTLIVKMVGS